MTVDTWRYFREAHLRSIRELALSCIFLNRTSFSGILCPTSGPIGGYSQGSQYKIDCRFTASTLVKRISQASRLRDRVLFVDRNDWKQTLAKVEGMKYSSKEVFYYLDPPFYNKARRLYRFFFDVADHEALHASLMHLQQPWLLSYDPAKQILDLYSHNGCGPKRVNLLYSASASKNRGEAQELIITNVPTLPEETRLWRSSDEWEISRTQLL